MIFLILLLLVCCAAGDIDPKSLTVKQVGELLQSLELGQYEAMFAREGIDSSALKYVDESDLERIGVRLQCHRRKLMDYLTVIYRRVDREVYMSVYKKHLLYSGFLLVPRITFLYLAAFDNATLYHLVDNNRISFPSWCIYFLLPHLTLMPYAMQHFSNLGPLGISLLLALEVMFVVDVGTVWFLSDTAKEAWYGSAALYMICMLYSVFLPMKTFPHLMWGAVFIYFCFVLRGGVHVASELIDRIKNKDMLKDSRCIRWPTEIYWPDCIDESKVPEAVKRNQF